MRDVITLHPIKVPPARTITPPAETEGEGGNGGRPQTEVLTHRLELNRINAEATIDYALAALRSIILVNGAAIVALLTFLERDWPVCEDKTAVEESLSCE